jgi:tripartite-type tricarboxylate transporter receptor subunit TctC
MKRELVTRAAAMSRLHLVAWIVAVVEAVFGAGAVHGQGFPVKPIRFVSTGIGASTDLAARTVAQGLTDSVGWNVVVDNRGSTIIAAEIVSRAPSRS